MKLDGRTLAGAVAAFVGQGLVLVAVSAAAIAAGGSRGADADLDTGGRGAVLMAVLLAYGVAQAALCGGLVVLHKRLGPASLAGILAGGLAGLIAGLYYLCGGSA